MRWLDICTHRGVRPGDRVAILSENRPEWAYADMATQILSAVNVSLYTTLPPKEVAYIVHDSGASVFIVSTGIQVKKAMEIYDLCPDLKRIVSMVEPRGEKPDYVDLFEEAMSSGVELYKEFKDAIHANEANVKPNDLSTLIYTSGTTGNPERCDANAFEPERKSQVRPATFAPSRRRTTPVILAPMPFI